MQIRLKKPSDNGSGKGWPTSRREGWHMEAKEKAEREWQEQLAELAWVNQE